ncbi:type II toxin-antitoxin system TacA family antitoxin, partial [Enterobacter asburiae]|uniref:type II toxin-antitoxin system TacA family antitoxin n=1 Tax=Enterobacter asburiae TaxID=61645 RepID=UPI000AA3340B
SLKTSIKTITNLSDTNCLEIQGASLENVILDRRVFNFNDEQYAEFIDMLDAPVSDEAAIDKLLARKPQWDV